MSTQSSTHHKTRSKFPVTQWIRHAVQLVAFLLFPGLFISVFGALRDIIESIVTLSFSLQSEGTQLLILIAVFPITILWGRFFCGYLCSFGAMGDLMHFVGLKLHIRQLRVSERTDSILKKIKYVIFLLILVFLWIPVNQIDSSLSPWTAFGMIATLNFDMLFSVGSLLLVLIMVGSLFIERFFCRYLCPLGAVFSLVSAGRLFKIRRKPSACVSCGRCHRECPVGIPVDRVKRVTSGECIDCMKCADVCPASCIYANPTPAVAGTAAALSMMGLVYVGRVASGSLTDTTASAAVTTSDEGKYTDGTYTGSGQGYKGTTTVEVTVSGGNITDITVVSYADDDEFFNKAKSTIISEILSAQSTDVDTVSGATFSSNGLIDAVADALSAAGGDTLASSNSASADTQTEESDTDQTAVDSADTSSSSASSSDTSDSSSGSSDTSGSSSDSSSSDTSASSATDIDLSSVTDGTYTGSGTGLRGTTEVSVTVENGQITDITILSYQDDQQYFERASSTIIDEILSSQSIQVSTVSGATFSSNGILEAVADALGTDWTNPNSTMSSGSGHGGHGGI